MKPIEFNEQNVVWAKNQPPYIPLPAHVTEEESISLWKLSWRERIRILLTGKVWTRQLNFGRRLQPITITLEYPFVSINESDS